MLCCVVICCIVLYYIIVCYVILCSVVLCCIVLCCSVLLWRVTPCRAVVWCVIIHVFISMSTCFVVSRHVITQFNLFGPTVLYREGR